MPLNVSYAEIQAEGVLIDQPARGIPQTNYKFSADPISEAERPMQMN